MKKILAIIPARSGSKGLPDKNILPLCGKPLLGHTIDAALRSGVITKVVVSTDSENYRAIAIAEGAEVPFLRPKDLADDSSSIADVIHHSLEYFEKQGESFDLVILLQPTSPLRRPEHIKEAVEKYEREAISGVETLISIVKAPVKSKWLMDIKNNYINFCFDFNLTNPQRQQLSQLYLPNGAIYIATAKHFDKSFCTDKTLYYEMNDIDSTDIDTIEDFQLAERQMKCLKGL
ncbi:MAG: acylneuraminate cytidylyltransferase family protein [Bacteriovorax sp.]|jgi:CMP-N-acetylneuraminic acid synthetase